MTKPDTREPSPWEPSEHGAFILELDADGEPRTLHTFARRRGADLPAWSIFEVCELREIDPMSPSGWVERDGGFNFWFHMEMGEALKATLVAFIEGADHRLHHDEDERPWVFE